MVATGPPSNCHLSKGEFLDLDRDSTLLNFHERSGSMIVTSPMEPGIKVPRPLRLNILAGFDEQSSTNLVRLMIPLLISSLKDSPIAVSRPVIPKGARSYSSDFSSAW